MKKYLSVTAPCLLLAIAAIILALGQIQTIPNHLPVQLPDNPQESTGTLAPVNAPHAKNVPVQLPGGSNNTLVLDQIGTNSNQETPTSPIEEQRHGEFLVAEDGNVYPIERYKTLFTPNDPYASQWWHSKVGLQAAWDFSIGSNQTTLAIIDTGFALQHEDFANRWYENTGEKGATAAQQPSRLNCTEQSLALNKSCNVIDDNFDGIIDNESGLTTLQNRSLRNCTDQGRALEKDCNMVDDDGNGLIDDKSGWDFVNYERSVQAGETNPSGSGTTHGTMVAGVAAATGNNAKGTAGADWFTKILPIQALDDDSYGDTLTVSRSIRYAADQGADVISISLGTASPDTYMRQAVAYAISKGSIVVAAAGNDGCQCMSYPARYDEVIAVGASDQNDALTSFSSWGDTLDVIAPGISMISSTWTNANQTSAYAGGIAGTSFSAPLVAGMLSLARSHQPQASAGQLVAALTEQTNRLSLPSTVSKSTQLGYGRLESAALISRVRTSLMPIFRYGFSPISGGNFLGVYEPAKPFLAYTCETTRPGTSPIYRLSKGATIFYTVSEVERYQAIAQGYTSTLFSNACMNLPTDQPQIIRSLSIPREFENRNPDK
ncbi:MAG: S8 family serine peptidase [Patescibacteria group bacterium]